MQGFATKIKYLSFAIIFLSLSTTLRASDFNIPFINAAGLGNLYAGWAAEANDASTVYANPAGLIRITHQQLVLAALGVQGKTEFTGTTTPPFPPFAPQVGSASSKLSGFIPSFYYAIPINPCITFGIGETVPFALGTSYDKDSILRYAATRSQVNVIDFTPAVGIKITDQLSVGAGFDAERLSLSLNNLVGFPPFVPDSESQNNLTAWGYGWHAGILYQFTPCTRLGINYNSQIKFHATGDSKFFSAFVPGGELSTNDLTSNATLPALMQVSLYHDFNQQWTAMGTIFYTRWRVLNEVRLKNVITPVGLITTVTPFNYHDTFDYAVGVNYKPNKQWILRTGLEFLHTPTNDQDRIVANPIGGATIVGIGAHYQQNCHLGYDVSYAHSFFKRTSINHVTPLNTEFGRSSAYTNVLGLQLTWDI